MQYLEVNRETKLKIAQPWLASTDQGPPLSAEELIDVDGDAVEPDHAEAYRTEKSVDVEEEPCDPTATLWEEELDAAFNKPAGHDTEQYYVDVTDPEEEEAEDVGGLDHEGMDSSHSITRFLTLLTVAAVGRMSNRKRDPTVDFSKSVMLTTDTYVYVVQDLKAMKDDAAKEKEKNDLKERIQRRENQMNRISK